MSLCIICFCNVLETMLSLRKSLEQTLVLSNPRENAFNVVRIDGLIILELNHCCKLYGLLASYCYSVIRVLTDFWGPFTRYDIVLKAATNIFVFTFFVAEEVLWMLLRFCFTVELVSISNGKLPAALTCFHIFYASITVL